MVRSQSHGSTTVMEIQYTTIAHILKTAATAALIWAVCAIIAKINHKSHLARLPALHGTGSAEKQRQAYLYSAKKLYFDGYEKVSTSYL